ncbi:MAG: FHA domain-containing protein [Planctomycetes bacterium]|nr:FHA domain-containing protein [Planctomycetota bacterium]MBL7106446.1 FHA domain-containing protein [Phycisphaerae bacterium]
MYLIVKKDGGIVLENNFDQQTIHIGRHPESLIVLADKRVSRHHATIYTTTENQWILEDLDSVNKTYLNGEPIKKSPLKSGDIIKIADYEIEANLEKKLQPEDIQPKTNAEIKQAEAEDLEDTIITTSKRQQTIIRKIQDTHAPEIKLHPKRIKDFVDATEMICKSNGIDEILHTLLNIASKQFNPWHCWIALRNAPHGPMTCHSGRKRNGTIIEITKLTFKEKIEEAIESGHLVLVPRFAYNTRDTEHLQSIMIVPVCGKGGCFGVIYMDNDPAHTAYDLSDLDYLMLLAIHTSVVLENF